MKSIKSIQLGRWAICWHWVCKEGAYGALNLALDALDALDGVLGYYTKTKCKLEGRCDLVPDIGQFQS